MQTYRIFIRDLVLPCRIGVHDREKRGPQRVRLNVELLVEWPSSANDDYRRVLNYETTMAGLRALVQGKHVNLVETLAERLVDHCLQDARVKAARIELEKLDVYPEAASVGVVVQRRRPMGPG
jgi:dihydroneopterin aldolase